MAARSGCVILPLVVVVLGSCGGGDGDATTPQAPVATGAPTTTLSDGLDESCDPGETKTDDGVTYACTWDGRWVKKANLPEPTWGGTPVLSLQAAVDQCANDSSADQNARMNMKTVAESGPPHLRDLAQQTADERGQTLTQYYKQLWSDVLTLDEDGSITIQAVGQTYDTDEDWQYSNYTQLGVYQETAWFCLSDALDLPLDVERHINYTAPSDGTQTDSWAGYEASWTVDQPDGWTITVRETD
jgi:hypothetical protein